MAAVQPELTKTVLLMLCSEEANDRKTGALLCGQEKLPEAIPALKKLLSDPAWFMRGSTIILYVREAAKVALESMGACPDGVVTRLPEKGHLKIDKDTGRYIVDFEGYEEQE